METILYITFKYFSQHPSSFENQHLDILSLAAGYTQLHGSFTSTAYEQNKMMDY